MKKPLWHPSRLLLLLLLLLIGATVAYVLLQVRTDRVKDMVANSQNVLLDLIVTEKGKPLCNEVLFYNPTSHKTAFLDVPPDTGGLIQSLGKVEALSALYKPNSMKAYLDELGDLLAQKISFYLILDLKDLERQVDLVSGIDLFISSSVELTKTDPMFLLPSGNNVLDGTKVREFLTAPHENEDSADRASRFQHFALSWFRKLGENQSFLNRSSVFPYFWNSLSTNLEDIELKSFLKVCSVADWERSAFQRVLGTFRQVDGQTLLFPHYNGSLLKDTVHQILEALPRQDPEAFLPSSVKVEILNGTSLPGLAVRTALLLRSFGYNVLSYKNADSTNVVNTVVIDRRGNPGMAKKLAEILQCNKIVEPAPGDTAGDADVTLILGKDFDGRYVRQTTTN
jgi:anionic cell wall polymer biosynthesis LytR-Cps2A-Psr (LCP) family protein